MVKNNNIIILIILIIGGIFLIGKISLELQALIPIEDGIPDGLPKGIGYGDLGTIDDDGDFYKVVAGFDESQRCWFLYGAECANLPSPLLPVRTIEFGATWMEDPSVAYIEGPAPLSQYNACQDYGTDYGFKFSNLICIGKQGYCDDETYLYKEDSITTGDATDYARLSGISNDLYDISVSDISATINIKISDNNLLNADVETPLFFEDQTHTMNINLNPSSALGAFDEEEVYIFAWLEWEVPDIGNARQDAIDIYGKPIILYDLSKLYNLGPSPNTISFEMGQLPMGEYNFYAVITHRFVSEGGLCDVCYTGDGPTCLSTWKPLTPYIHSNFLVNPKRITIAVFEGEPVPEGYEPQRDEEFSTGVCDPIDEGASTCVCVRDDLMGLPCVRIGCPIAVDPDTGELISYSCGSDGFCSEVLFHAEMCDTDADCNEGEICEPTSGMCFNEDIFYSFVGCESSADCWDPNCIDSNGEEVTWQCINNQCVYSGQCDVDLSGDCRLLDCPPGFVCMDDGRCVRISEEDITEPPLAELETPVDKFFALPPLILLAVGLGIGWYIYKKRKK